MKFAADIFSENSTRESLNVIHVTAEKQSVRVTLQNCKLCPSETFLLRFNPFLCAESSE